MISLVGGYVPSLLVIFHMPEPAKRGQLDRPGA